MKRLLITGILILAASPFAHANKIIGNGGIVLECKDAPKVRLLDFYEAEAINYTAPEMPQLTLSDPEGATYQEKFYSLIGRISLRFPGFARAITQEFENFEAQNRMVSGINLGETKDDYNKFLPFGCEKKNIAIQQEPAYLRSPMFIVSKELWDQLDARGKAGLVLHEAIYRIGIKNGLDNSVGIRYLVGLLFANELDEISDEDWIKAFQGSNLPYYEMGPQLRLPLFESEGVNCEPPSRLVVKGSSRLGKRVEMTFSKGRLQAVNFNSEQKIEFETTNSVRACLLVRDLRFDWSRQNVEIVTAGKVHLVSTMLGTNDTLQMDFKGRIQPRDGLISGVQTVLSGDGKTQLVRNYDGSFFALINGGAAGVDKTYAPFQTLK